MSMKTSNVKFKDRIHLKMKDESMRAAVANAQERMFKSRAVAAEKLGNWEEWREMGMDIRNHVLENLDYYLQQLSENVEKMVVMFSSPQQQKMQLITSKRLLRKRTPKKS